MISLIKNELFKIIHKPGLYILLAFAFVSLVFGCFIESYDDSGTVGLIHYYEGLEEKLNSYDLNNPSELSFYIGDKTIVEAYKLYKDFRFDSPEYYYVDNDITDNIQCMNEALYRDKDEVGYNECKKEYDKQIELLNNFDWKSVIYARINNNDEMIKEYNSLKTGDLINDSEMDSQINYLKEENRIYNYRLENNIPLTYSELSIYLEDYLSFYVEYQSLELDESKYASRSALENKREVESQYLTLDYMLENDMLVTEMEEHTANNFRYIFEYFDIFLVIAAIMIAGSIVSEEFNKGTIKQLLLKPFTRTNILTSKIVASLIAFLGFTVVYTLLTVLISSIFFKDLSSFLNPVVVYDFNKSVVVEYGVFEYSMLHFVSLMPAYIIIMLFTLVMGVVTTNTASAITGGFVFYGLSTLMSEFALTKSLVFLPFIHWDFSPYLFGGLHWYEFTNFGLSLFIVVVFIIILLGLCYFIFNRKDIKNQ